jgi:predicted Zn-dependent peptidase
VKARIVPLLLLLTACGGAPQTSPSSSQDALGPRPTLAAPKTFTPPVPAVSQLPSGLKVWLVERHDLPLVAVHVVVPYGSAADPAGKGGLAALTAEMMEQGAGARGALELGQAVERLGADMTVNADRDSSDLRLVVLRPNLEAALDILADVLSRPRFEDAEWKRTQPLWIASLRSRAFEPPQVAAIAADAALFGPAHPYGHPIDGTLASVGAITLDDVKAFHRDHWRPDRATIVVAGDVKAEELDALFGKRLWTWTAKGEAPPVPTPPPTAATAPRTVLVERPGAAQTMLEVVAPGPAAGSPEQPALDLVNVVLGGSFTSRLNQNLREDKGYTYGARSSVPFLRGPYRFAAGAAVQSEVTTPALAELLKELSRMVAEGPTPAEVDKARATARDGDVEAYEAIGGTADRLAALAATGLPPDYDASSARARDAVAPDAARATAAHLPYTTGTVIAVGDPAVVEAALKAAGLPAPVRLDPEGAPVAK